jgi:hypothetical protein
MRPLTIPQGRIPVGYAMVQGQRVPVEIDQEWMLYLTTLTERTGGVSGDTNFIEYINQFFDAPLADPALQEAGRAIDELRNELAASRSDAQTSRVLCEEVSAQLAGVRRLEDLRNRLDGIEAQIDAGRPSPLPITTEQFIAPTLLNSWVNFGSGFNDAGYFKDANGVVHLRGLIKSGVIGTAAFNLPIGYRPKNTELINAISNNALGRLDILNTGDINLAAGSNIWFSLDSITFRAA